MKNFIFASILLALLLTVNAAPYQLNKRATTFNPCPSDQAPNAEAITVTIGTDPPKQGEPEKFDVSGTLTKHDISKEKTFLGIGYADTSKNPIGNPFVQNFTQDFKSGSQFTISASDVPTPKDLPSPYVIAVIVGDPTGDPTKPDVYGCAFAIVS
ncbi:hypothetical protein F8M41_019532 [Gigaspora margarita]|uniref:MD-2-related lipid-recognition domain-containing protein n=1 Tax=Gigaspora margarita TaxID=4874 RepID=A0A8H4EKJ6_GIGMA|nr:hypothetical protein F8M41_019532 [Gigaspora margarita]